MTVDTPNPVTHAKHSERSPIPLLRIVKVELRKSFDTRSGSWLLAGIGIAAVLATLLTLLFASDDKLRWSDITAAIGVPIGVILPLTAILSVTSEWSQRSGLTSFTLVPNRSRVIAGKLIAAITVGVASMIATFAISALGTALGSAMVGTDPLWDGSVPDALNIILYQVLTMLVGFMLGVLIRNSAGAIVAYFVYSYVLPTLSMVLAFRQDWFRNAQTWVDFNQALRSLLNDSVTSEQWTHIGVTSLVWLVIPLLLGLRLVMKTEVK